MILTYTSILTALGNYATVTTHSTQDCAFIFPPTTSKKPQINTINSIYTVTCMMLNMSNTFYNVDSKNSTSKIPALAWHTIYETNHARNTILQGHKLLLFPAKTLSVNIHHT